MSRYIECLDSIFNSLSFVFTDIETARYLFTKRRPPVIDDIQSVNISFRLRVRPIHTYKGSRRGDPRPWLEVTEALGQLDNIKCTNVWFNSIPDNGVERLGIDLHLFHFIAHLASVLTVNLPALEWTSYPCARSLLCSA